jgi:aminoglycoside phosphotransferase family enzyme/predicted kinase
MNKTTDCPAEQQRVIRLLLCAHPYEHATTGIALVETHISWVILTGTYAYKIKKALTLEFLDFGTLARRRHFCEEELRLNRQWAPQIYLDVVPISLVDGGVRVGDDSNVVEYALKMMQFMPGARLDLQLKHDKLTVEDVKDLAVTIADYHGRVRRIDFTNEREAFELVRSPVVENFPYVRQVLDDAAVNRIDYWSSKRLVRLRPLLVARHRDGFVRECHGDLHLSNLARLKSGIVPFDCIEFNPGLRNIDVISDFAFLAMDLVFRGRQDLAYTLINRYLERTGDFEGMELFGLYFVYHCMIRAKVAAIRYGERSEGSDRQKDLDEVTRYCKVALDWIDKPRPRLFAMHGYSGSGKTWASYHLLQELPAIRLRSDIERKRLFGLDETQPTDSAIGEGVYSEQGSSRVYRKLNALAENLIAWGYNVILDATFLSRRERDQAVSTAHAAGVPIVFVHTEAGSAVVRSRVKHRAIVANVVSEADAEVLAHQEEFGETLTAAELERTVHIRTDGRVNWDHVLEDIEMVAHRA